MPALSVDDLELPVVTTTSEAYLRDPHAAWRAAREASWCARTDIGLAVITYRDNAFLLRKPGLGSVGASMVAEQGVTSGPIYDYISIGSMFAKSGERHVRVRRLLTHGFTPRVVDHARPIMRRIARRLIDAFSRQGSCDFVRDFSSKYPVEVIAGMIGLPAEDIPHFSELSDDIGLTFSIPLTPPARERAERAVSGLYEYVSALVEERRRRPEPDSLLSALITALDSSALSDGELKYGLVDLIFAGHDTTRNQLASLVFEMASRPEQWRMLAGAWQPGYG